MIEIVINSDVKDPLGPEIKVPLTVLKVLRGTIDELLDELGSPIDKNTDFLSDQSLGAYMILKDRIKRAEEFRA